MVCDKMELLLLRFGNLGAVSIIILLNLVDTTLIMAAMSSFV